MTTRRVAVVQRVLTHYRVPFFVALRDELAERDIELRLIYGQSEAKEVSKRDTLDLEWGTAVRNRYVRLGGRSVCWQPVVQLTGRVDLVVVEQAARLLVNPVLAARSMVGPSVAVWGHGRNMNSAASSALAEALKRATLNWPAWWFAYTNDTEQYLRERGVDSGKITVVNNAVDTAGLARLRRSIDEAETQAVRQEYGLPHHGVGAFVGSLYPEKRLGFLVSSADLIRERCPGFHLLVVGDGPDRAELEALARTRPWLHVLGALHGRPLVRVLSAADALLNPGLVGLGILDGFAFRLPTVTTDVPFHSPEIAYLVHGINGLVVSPNDSSEAFASAVVELLSDRDQLDRLRDGCDAAAANVTVERMAKRFADGVEAAMRRSAERRPSTGTPR